MLITKEEANYRCMLYASDCEEAIWSKHLDLNFFINLRKELQLGSALKVFIRHFAESLQAASSLEKTKIYLKINIKLEIGEGLQMSCSTFVESRVHFNNPDEFKTHLRRFIVGLWDVKASQLKGQLDKAEQEKK